jgi:hypothetical protein|nr:MAG TPA: hypothetical protein [Caudoviricetes sp.]
MAIRTDEDLEKVFSSIIKDVITSVSDRAKKLLQQHINTDTYGIGKSVTGHPSINKSYLNGTGTPSYEFRDVAWNIKLQNDLKGYLFSLFYDEGLLSQPTYSSPYLHGNIYENKDRRKELPDLLNVSGISPESDFINPKIRNPFWDNFEQELKQKLGNWLYTEFNNRGLSIPSLKNARFG